MEQVFKMTAAGKAALEKELAELTTTGRIEVAEKLNVARSYGDLSENSEYDEAKSEQDKVEARIKVLKYQLQNAVIVAEPSKTYRVLRLLDNKELTITVVGFGQEGKGMVTDDTPVGAALSGAKVGDTVSLEAPIGTYELKVLEITEVVE